MKRCVTILALTACLLALVPFPVMAQAPRVTDIKVSYAAPSFTYAAMFVATDKGLFRKHGVNPELIFAPGAQSVQAVASGDAQINTAAAIDLAAVRLAGADIVTVAALLETLGFMMVTRPEVGSVKELKGKTGGDLGPATALRMAGVMILESEGVAYTDVTYGPIGGFPVMLQALKAGRIDFTMIGSPWDVEASRMGLKVIADSAKLSLPKFMLLGVNVQRKYLAANRDVVVGFVKGLVEGVRYCLANREEAKQIVGRWLKLTDQEVLESGYRYYVPLYKEYPEPTAEGIKSALDFMARFPRVYGVQAAGADPAAFMDLSVVEELGRQGFIRRR